MLPYFLHRIYDQGLKPSTVYLRRQSNWAREWVNKQGVPENKSLGPRYYSRLYTSRHISP